MTVAWDSTGYAPNRPCRIVTPHWIPAVTRNFTKVLHLVQGASKLGGQKLWLNDAFAENADKTAMRIDAGFKGVRSHRGKAA